MASESSTSQARSAEEQFGINVLASTLAHEIRNPLQVMRIQLEAAMRGGSTKDAFENISSNLDRLESVVERIQRLTHRYSLQPKTVNLRDVLESVFSSVRFWLGAAGIQVYEHFHWEGEPIIEIDQELIEQVLLNLVTNAIQAMPTGGQLSVSVSECETTAEIEVADTGCGMSSETLARVGTPFFTTKDNGSGLGLAFCKSIVTLHKGSFDIESEEGKGTRIVVKLTKTLKPQELN